MIRFCDDTACVVAGCDPVLCTGRGVPSNYVLFERSQAAIDDGPPIAQFQPRQPRRSAHNRTSSRDVAREG